MRTTPMTRPLGAALLLWAALGSAFAGEATVAYTVSAQDTLIGIGQRVLTSPAAWPEVARLNRLPDANRITPGQVLQMPVRLLRSAQVPAQVVAVSGQATLAGQPLRAGDAVLPGQPLQVGDSSSVLVRLGDGSTVKLLPLSQSELGEHRRYELRATGAEQEGLFATTMRLLSGSLEVLASKVQRAKPLEVSTPTAVIGVRGTEYRVRHAADRSGTEVLSGRVQADVGPQGIALDAGFGAALHPGQAPRAVALLPAPDLGALPERFERPVLRFALPGAEPWQVQVAADPEFTRVVRELAVPAGGEARVAGLDDGTWQLRVRRVDGQGIQGRDSQRAVLLKARPEPPAPIAPVDRAKQSVGTVPLRWAENTEAARYRLQVAADPAFSQLLSEADGLQGGATEVRLETPGVVWWRLGSVRADGDRGPWGDPQRIELRALPEPPSGGLQGERLTLAWSGRPEDRQEVQLARDPGFQQLIASETLDQPRWDTAKPAQPGTVYFRYRSVESDGFISPWSSTLKLEIPRDWASMGWIVLPLLLAL